MSSDPAGLPAPRKRTPVHTRDITYQGFRRDDGLWDFDAQVQDRKHYAFVPFEGDVIPEGTPYHSMLVRLTVDDALKVVEVVTTMQVTPYPECHGATAPMQRLVGAALGRGWRKSVNDALAGTAGCTHVREMLYNLATAAMQTVPAWLESEGGVKRGTLFVQSGPPAFLNGCHAWALEGTVVLRHYPQFAKPKNS